MIELTHMPALVVVAPLMAAALCALIRHSRLCWWLATLTLTFSCVCIVVMGRAVFDGNVLSYAMGSWAPRGGGRSPARRHNPAS